MVGLELIYYYLFYCFSKTCLINNPKFARLLSYDCWRPLYLIKQSKFSESISIFKLFCIFIVNFDLNRPCFNYVEACTYSSLAKDLSIRRHLCQKHLISYILQLFIRKIVEDKMIFEAVKNENLICFFSGELYRIYSLHLYSSSYFV